ncbi:lysophospholipid acyltransferase family protein [Aestuariibaculum sediminum]|uniref:Lysophospholipid acyltransferase family protein n=1 Tax=Aestuariibaculum sediminum TaxID=2770637 RepID=A0A8J6U840_9FLAO|nr:lysophospholipid acyltransferase family protein [Aestuariibaculum sediminum]MBD0832800.1 lysophospholipid acyltransferase family protein [Aestuariibaculum sediminum]
MQFIAYILVYPILWMVSILPFRLLYLVSDGLYLLMFYIIGYRKKVVKSNLKLVFPEKSDAEIKTITKKFYHHLCDMFLEMAKTLTISEKQLKERFKVKNPEEFQRLEKLNRSVILMFGHYASWEWSLELQRHTSFNGLAVYKKLSNKYFDALVRRMRSKYNTELISTKETIATITQYENKNIKSIIGFLSDQSPRLSKEVYWGDFMGITVPCYTGAERLAKKLDLPTAFLKVTKIKRGYYEAELKTLAEDSKSYNDYELTDLFLREVEKQIDEAPEFYFWTHKRWKYKDRKPD